MKITLDLETAEALARSGVLPTIAALVRDAYRQGFEEAKARAAALVKAEDRDISKGNGPEEARPVLSDLELQISTMEIQTRGYEEGD